MTNMQLFHDVSQDCSRNTTEKYSTSFFSSIKLLGKSLRQPIFNIYGFVRFADEIVDTFHEYDKEILLKEFKEATYQAIERKISLNPIINSFQITVNQYGIDISLVEAFLHSMELDLGKQQYDAKKYEEYIYGSAEVVGLMCLYVFCNGDKLLYEELKPGARSLGSAFQKVNFLRDLKADYMCLDRLYFPGCDFRNFTETDKRNIELDIQNDFDKAYSSIIKLPLQARFGVYVAYKYYLSLFYKIKSLQPQRILQERIRIPDYNKFYIVAKAGIRSQFNLL